MMPARGGDKSNGLCSPSDLFVKPVTDVGMSSSMRAGNLISSSSNPLAALRDLLIVLELKKQEQVQAQAHNTRKRATVATTTKLHN